MVSETTYNISGAQIGNELLASTRSLTSSGWRDSSQEMPPKISVGDVPTPNILQKRCYQISNIQHEHLRKLTSYPCSLKFEEPFFARCSASTMIEQINILCKNKFQPSCKYKYFNMLFSDFHPNHSWNLGQVASTFNFDKFCKGFTQRAIDSCGTLCLGCQLTRDFNKSSWKNVSFPNVICPFVFFHYLECWNTEIQPFGTTIGTIF